MPSCLEVGLPRSLAAIVIGLRDRGVAFRSLTEQMDTTTPNGELLFSISGALAQYERALTQERVKAGWLRQSAAADVAADHPRSTMRSWTRSSRR